LLNRRDDVVPIPGTSSLQRVEENALAADIELSDGEIDAIESAAPKGAATGQRYEASGFGLLNG
jgi:aryl-alcohol dehydrogenase-like predicted oxidoreductase